MEKKRSKGVTIFGIFFIFGSIAGLFTSGFNLFILDLDKTIVFYTFISSILLLILGINILRLKEWARKGTIYYHIATTLIGIYLSPLISNQSAIRLKNLGVTQKEIPDITTTSNFALIIPILLTLIVIYFFTRPKVKEQFK